jgi:putative ABC transport system substrate-binding protein
MPVVGYAGSTSLDGYVSDQVAAFRQGLNEAGFAEGQNVAIAFRWAEGQYDRLPVLVAEFVSRQVAVILAGSLPTALAAKGKTSTIPIVFVVGADPVKLGLVASLNRPGGNVTGISQYYGARGAKRLELLRELVPSSSSAIAIISNPKNSQRSKACGFASGTIDQVRAGDQSQYRQSTRPDRAGDAALHR